MPHINLLHLLSKSRERTSFQDMGAYVNKKIPNQWLFDCFRLCSFFLGVEPGSLTILRRVGSAILGKISITRKPTKAMLALTGPAAVDHLGQQFHDHGGLCASQEGGRRLAGIWQCTTSSSMSEWSLIRRPCPSHPGRAGCRLRPLLVWSFAVPEHSVVNMFRLPVFSFLVYRTARP